MSMKVAPGPRIRLYGDAPNLDDVEAEVLAGLSRPQKELPAKLFYDRKGSQLFDQICELEEYYLTRTETGILARRATEIAELTGPGGLLVEFGSGSSRKTRILLDALPRPAGYVPIDISREHLLESAGRIAEEYPELMVCPLWADYTQLLDLSPFSDHRGPLIVFFPGSTIGNFRPMQSVAFLRRVAASLSHSGGLLIGFDLKKDPVLLHRAYNDSRMTSQVLV